ncbi:MAG: hypothetical protein ABWK53_06485 [Anaerolineales bacterium]
MKILPVLITLGLLLSACRPVSAPSPASGLDCVAVVEGIRGLQTGLRIPDHFTDETPVRTGTEFDPNQYFSVLTHLSMAPGMTLDYVYHRDGLGAFPVLYARPLDQPRFATEADLVAAGVSTDYLASVQSDGSAQGYFELVALRIMGGQFYLDWHANYNDTQIVCNRQQAVAIARSLDGDFGQPMSPLDRLRVRLLNGVEPAVSIGEQTVEVRLVTFSHWGGFSRLTVSLQRTFPHSILETHEDALIPYDCGILF